MRQKITYVLCAMLLIFIWGNSLLNQENSQNESAWILNLLSPLFDSIFGEGRVTLYLLRRAAHLIEYTCLGVLSSIVLNKHINKRTNKLTYVGFFSLSLGLFVAVIDETIQYFSGRTSTVLDVWLDMSGVLAGTCIVLLILFIVSSRPNRR